MGSRRSMKNRIRRTINFSNFTGILIISLIMIFVVGFLLKSFGFFISVYLSSKISSEISASIHEARVSGLISAEYDRENPEFQRILNSFDTTFSSYLNDVKDMEGFVLSVNMQNDRTPLINYRVFVNGEQIYDNADEESDSLIFRDLTKKDGPMKFLNYEVIKDVDSGFENLDMKIGVSLNPNILFFVYLIILIIYVAVMIISLLVSKLFSMLLTVNITKPLTDLQQKMYQLAEGDIESAIHTEIELKKPIMEVEQLANITNMIMSRMQEYAEMMASQKEELEAQNDALEENSGTLSKMNIILENRNQKLENILNSVGQGFLTFKNDLKIESEYSLECEKFFPGPIKDNTLSQLLYPEEPSQRKFVDDILEKIMVTDSSRRMLYMPLLPEEIEMSGIYVNIEYKVVSDEDEVETMMVILTDITDRRELEMKMDEERRILKMVVKAMVNREEFVELVNSFERFAGSGAARESESYDSMLRKIHTFKGNFSQYEMINLVPNLHELENKLYEEQDPYIMETMYSNMKTWLEDDLEIIRGYIGNDFFANDEMFHIEKKRIVEIEEKLRLILSPAEFENVVPIIRSLRCKSLKEMLKTYPDYVMKLSERLGKSVKPFEIEGDDEVKVDSQNYHKLVKSLVHVFRNAVDHGIEDEDERIENGKEIHGSISCEISRDGEEIEIKIHDDGRGIDLERVKEKIIETGIAGEQECEMLGEEEIYELLLVKDITTKEEATQVSGRGVGLSALKEEVDGMKGRILIESEIGLGTTFRILIPDIIKPDIQITPECLLQAILETSKEYVRSQSGIELRSGEVEKKNKIELSRITALMDIQGGISAIVMLSVNMAMGRKLVENFMYEKVKEEEIDEIVEDVLGEVSNTIIGNSFGKFEYGEDMLHMGVPAMISNDGAYIKYTDSEMLTSTSEFGECIFGVHMIVLENVRNIKDFKEESLWQEF